MTRSTPQSRYVTMSRRPTLTSVYTVRDPAGAVVLETFDFSEACQERRACGGVIVPVAHDVSPSWQ